ncbi:uncharacterized protein N7483_011844 [Penicillium malachiteum]|uniref:uncharacterized protein n=1 Tax=Penicillium malachiteum TaxID=1324776 RepID=UPI00254852D4|nr:uncharacterized protein N7483_011844 [Penicillium malachiteum]KAJ5714663.1 hypothetical protein N7483_011844 [Penicillium malachiteum]
MADQESGTSNQRSFKGQATSAEDMLKSQTVGLVHLSDFRKRRAEVLEQKEREAHDKSLGRLASGISRSATPSTGEITDGSSTPRSDGPPKKKKKKALAKSKLSFGDDEEETGEDSAATPRESSISRSGSKTPAEESAKSAAVRMKANPNAPPPPKAQTKAAIEAEAQARDTLRKEFLVMQEAIKNTEILIPFVFFDGTSIPAGSVKVKKGDHVWLFLDRCRKVGAELGVRGASGAAKARKDSRREWARISVDDLMLVKGNIIVPHHYEFYYFISNRVSSFSKTGGLLFDYSNKPPPERSDDNPLFRPSDQQLEGEDKDSAETKVVDRRCKNFTEKYTGLKTETDKAASNANSEIFSLRKKVSDLQASQEELKKKNQELVDQYREKSKKLSQMTTLYNLLKARTLHSQMETAAANSVTKTLKTNSSRSGQPTVATPSGSSYAPSLPNIPQTSFPRTSSSRESVSTISVPRTSFPVDADGVEQLHLYQKSGSAGSGSSSRSNRVSKTPVKDTSMGPPLWPASWTRNRE